MTSEKAIRLGIKTIPISLRNAALKRFSSKNIRPILLIPISLRNAALKLNNTIFVLNRNKIPISLRNAALKHFGCRGYTLLPVEIPISLRNAALKHQLHAVAICVAYDSYFAA